MASRLFFTSNDGETLFTTDGTTVTRLANGSSGPAFLSDPVYFSTPYFITVNGVDYVTMADTTDGTSAIWQYSGNTLNQITASSNYVYTTPDTSLPTTQFPEVAFNNELVFSQATLASNVAGDGNFDTAGLAVFNPGNGSITQPATPHGGYDPRDFTTIGSTLYFVGTDSTTGQGALYAFNGTTVTEIAAPNGGENPQSFAVIGNTLYYEAQDSSTYNSSLGNLAIYSYNGTSATEIYNLHPTYNNTVYNATELAAGSVQGALVAFNNNIYFGSGQQTVYELNSLTSLSNSATNRAGAAEYSFGANPATNLFVGNSHLFFLSTNNGVYALSTGNTLTNLVGSIGAQEFLSPVVYNSAVYFLADYVSGANLVQGLYSSNGSSATLVSGNFAGNSLTLMGSTLYFGNGGTTLGTVNGTTVGSLSVPGNLGGVPLQVVTPTTAPTGWSLPATNPASITAGASPTYHKDQPVAIDGGIIVNDSSSVTLTSATVVIDAADAFNGDTLNFTSQNGITGSYNTATYVLTLNGSASLANYQIALRSITYSFNAALNGGVDDATNGGTDLSRTIAWAIGDGTNNSVAATSTLNIACFAAGTRIRTPGGAVAVEALRPGDAVLTASGRAVPVAWLGYRHLHCRRHPHAERVWPVRVMQDAFASGVPERDLWLSPEHAVFIGGALIPIRCLVNGATIQRDPWPEVTYWHVELPRHDVILAEGLACESYLDCGNRDAFANGGAFLRLHPDFTPRRWERDACAPLCLEGAAVAAARAALRRRAEALGFAASEAPALRLEIDGRLVEPAMVRRHVWRFPVPAGTRRAVLRSRVAYNDADPAAAFGYYPLGVKLARITQWAGDRRQGIDLADPGLGSGFYGVETQAGQSWRWTDGAAVIPLTLARVTALEIEIAATATYLARPETGIARYAGNRLGAGRPPARAA